MDRTKLIIVIVIFIITAGVAGGTFYFATINPQQEDTKSPVVNNQQTGRLTIGGSVICKSGGTSLPIPKAKITIINETLRTFVEVETDDRGNFSFFNFQQPGKYDIEVQTSQFKDNSNVLSNSVLLSTITSVIPLAKSSSCESSENKYAGCNLEAGLLYTNFDFIVTDQQGLCTI